MFSQPRPPPPLQHGQEFSQPVLPKHEQESVSPPAIYATTAANPDAGKMVEALSRPMAYLEGDPGESKTLKVRYVCLFLSSIAMSLTSSDLVSLRMSLTFFFLRDSNDGNAAVWVYGNSSWVQRDSD